jgi:hypothetical protein
MSETLFVMLASSIIDSDLETAQNSFFGAKNSKYLSK